MADDIWILGDQVIRVSFDTKGYTFYKGGKGIPGEPMEKYSQLVAVKGDDKVLIPTIPDLKGRVAIKSAEEALDFVRLFTAPETHYLFHDSRYIEPTAEEQRDMNLALKPVTYKETNGSFAIERNLVSRDGKLVRATERVTAEGDYSLEATEVVDEHSPIPYPLYQ